MEQNANLNGNYMGQCVIILSSFTGSLQYMHEKSQDAITYVRKHGNPDLFITFMCNPDWPEIFFLTDYLLVKNLLIDNTLYPEFFFGK